MKANIFLVISSKMDSNRKKDRQENELIRLGQKARANLGLNGQSTVELWPDSKMCKDRINRSRLLTIHEAFTEDLNKLRESGISEEEIGRAGFVTTKTFNFICRQTDAQIREAKSIWISNSVEDTVIGADPEFLLREGDCFRYAGEIPTFGYEHKLGSDGPSVELRPDPEIVVEDMVANISNILNKDPKTKKIMDYEWIAGAYFYAKQLGSSYSRVWTLGGHIHLGTPLKIINMSKDSGNLKSVFIVLKKILDELIAVPMLRVEGLEDNIKRRHDSNYGRVDDIRTDHDRLEYRTLSSYWLLHPDLATAVLGTAKAISHAYFNALIEEKFLKDIISFNKDWYNGNLSWKQIPVAEKFHATRTMSDLRAVLHEGKITFDRDFFEHLRKALRGLSTYKSYKKYIEKFITITKISEATLKKQTKELKEGWIAKKPYLI